MAVVFGEVWAAACPPTTIASLNDGLSRKLGYAAPFALASSRTWEEGDSMAGHVKGSLHYERNQLTMISV